MKKIFRKKYFRNKIKIILLPIFIVAISAGVFAFLKFEEKSKLARAGASDNVSGFAWSDNIGWISFNSADCDPDGDGLLNYGFTPEPPVDLNYKTGRTWSDAKLLTNGNVFVVYGDGGNGDIGTFKIIDKNNNIIAGPTVIDSSGYLSDVAVTIMQDGNVFVAYYVPAIGNYFAIYDSGGNFVKKTFLGDVPLLRFRGINFAATLNGGKIIMVAGGNLSLYVLYYNPTSGLVEGPYIFPSQPDFISVAPLNNGNALIAYMGYAGGGDPINSGDFVIVDAAGNKIRSGTFSSATDINSVTADTLTNNNVIISYHNYFGDRGQFVILDENGDPVVGVTDFYNNGDGETTDMITLDDGNIMFSYYNWGTSNGTFTVYNINGTQIITPTTLGDYYLSSQVQLDNGNVFMFNEAYPSGEVFLVKNKLSQCTYDCDTDNNGMIDKPSVYNEVFDSAIADAGASYNANYLSSVTLNNGNVLTAYPDYSNSYYGTFFISDPLGNIVKAPTVFKNANIFNSGKIGQLSAALNNGNILIVFSDGGNSNRGTFVIYDSSGNLVKAATVFTTNPTVEISAGTLKNGNVLIAYYDSFIGNQYFVIYDQGGNLVKSATQFGTQNVSKIRVKSFSGENAMIVYNSNDSADGRFIIINKNGSVVKPETIIDPLDDSIQPALASFANDRMLVAYSDISGVGTGKYAVYDSVGVVIKAPTVFSGNISNISATTLGDGIALVAYADNNNSGYGTYVNISSSGNLTGGPDVFRYSYVPYVSVVTLNNGTAYISFADGGLNGSGIIRIMETGGCGGDNVTTPVIPFVSDYGVNINQTTGNFSGYGWSPNIGWISFNEIDPPDSYTFNSFCLGTCNSSNNCSACYNKNNGQIYGWAKILNLGNDGWIKLRDDAITPWNGKGVKMDPATGNFSGWAWNGNGNDTGIGWISFNCADDGAGGCTGSDYKVRGYGSIPETPTNLIATPLDCTTIGLNWDHVASNETGFEAEWSASLASWSTVTTCSPGPGVHLCTVIVPEGTTRYFRVRANGAGGNSAWAPSTGGAIGTTPYCPPSLSVDTSTANCDRLTLVWSYNNPAVDHYEIWRNQDSAGWVMIEASIPRLQTSYNDIDIISGARYQYYIKAQTENINSNITASVKPCLSAPTWKETVPQ